jgi:hypothetical protein
MELDFSVWNVLSSLFAAAIMYWFAGVMGLERSWRGMSALVSFIGGMVTPWALGSGAVFVVGRWLYKKTSVSEKAD